MIEDRRDAALAQRLAHAHALSADSREEIVGQHRRRRTLVLLRLSPRLFGEQRSREGCRVVARGDGWVAHEGRRSVRDGIARQGPRIALHHDAGLGLVGRLVLARIVEHVGPQVVRCRELAGSVAAEVAIGTLVDGTEALHRLREVGTARVGPGGVERAGEHAVSWRTSLPSRRTSCPSPRRWR